jgi:hypothetical protein
MNSQKLMIFVLGGATLFVIWKVIQASNPKPLQDEIDPTNIKPDVIGRALNKLTGSGVKVNDTPTETINAIGK